MGVSGWVDRKVRASHQNLSRRSSRRDKNVINHSSRDPCPDSSPPQSAAHQPPHRRAAPPWKPRPQRRPPRPWATRIRPPREAGRPPRISQPAGANPLTGPLLGTLSHSGRSPSRRVIERSGRTGNRRSSAPYTDYWLPQHRSMCRPPSTGCAGAVHFPTREAGFHHPVAPG